MPKIIVQTCALAAEPLQERQLVAFLQALPLTAINSQKINPETIRSSVAELINLNLLDQLYQCHADLLEQAARDSAANAMVSALAPLIIAELPSYKKTSTKAVEHIWRRTLRDLRLALFTDNDSAYNQSLLLLLNLQEKFPRRFPENPLVAICNNPFTKSWFATLPLHVQLYALHQIFTASLQQMTSATLAVEFLADRKFLASLPSANSSSFYYLLINQLLLRGEITKARQFLAEAATNHTPLGLKGWLSFLTGDNSRALQYFEDDVAEIRKINRNPKAYFTGIEGLFYLLALLKEGNYAFHDTIRFIVTSIEEIQPHNLFLSSYSLLLAVVEAKENRIDLAGERIMPLKRSKHTDSISTLFLGLTAYWLEGKINSHLLTRIDNFYQLAQNSGYSLLAQEYQNLLRHGEVGLAQSAMTSSADNSSPCSIIEVVKPEEQWQRALRALNFTTADPAAATTSQTSHRLAWMVDYDKAEHKFSIRPKMQSVNNQGQWTKGRNISLKKLYSDKRPSFLSKQDQRICKTLLEVRDKRGVYFQFDLAMTFAALVGHPLVFLNGSPKTPVEVLKGEPELRVDQKNNFLHVSLYPEITDQKTVIIRETPTLFKVFPISDEHRRVADIISTQGLIVPVTGKNELFTTLGNISSFMTVHSTIDGSPVGIEEIQANPNIHLQLLPYGQGFRLAMLVKPLQPEGPYQKPGEGPKTIIAKVGTKRVQASRDLEQEEINACAVEQACPSLVNSPDLDREWILEDPEDCLQLLLELQSLPGEVSVEWPEGEKLTVSPPAALNQFNLNIRKQNNWFEMTGELKLDESLVLDMRKLLELARTTASRFIPLGHGHFLSLSRELRKRLDEINTFAELKKNTIRMHPLTSLALNDFTEGVGRLETDTGWLEQKQRLLAAQELKPQIPSTLQAELRDYQKEGFEWLARLADWGVGACLADDMGLGKTLQALAIILERAGRGPTLIVAPTSVCLNWEEEAKRFAPTLNIVIFGGRNRKKIIHNLKPFDILISSYGLLQQESELLATSHFQTIVLDEAQAIKNFITKRSRAAMRLNGEFKMITTGTPIENHLPELWNLFQFINPGLLGSINQFNQRYAAPIEKHNDIEAKKNLKKIISPFILRRIKAHVLEELPPRTEIVLQVEMSRRESAFYEAIRQQALENLSKTDDSSNKRPLQILAEITKLRRACCNPRLVMPESKIPSSKLELFGKVVMELLENRHKALVFSQFVGHLSLIRAFLDELNVSYRYLDGNTPARERQAQVKAFQAGEGDLFLISLKAGGLGLNLTAADYVIHMDPWWNPAVEDQASDRAHRIGQQRPVTIYRLVAKNTIEEKIVRLHQEKRALADSLLEGTNTSNNLTAADLLNLLKDI
ncbi:MAG: DEAD/DEAH box helicase [Desulfobulbaceae bacterium]|nr:DEAD/DEAH box helicase [Desulfobulbaceae bacterium]HIJ79318.1 DEAD/DEAH box helicase [Deltaproteobacteria bacterium]